jgi:hypothetical protein
MKVPEHLEPGKLYVYKGRDYSYLEKLNARKKTAVADANTSFSVRWFGMSVAQRKLTRRGGEGSYFVDFFNLPPKILMQDIVGTKCKRMLEFEYHYAKAEVSVIDMALLTAQSKDLIHRYLRDRANRNKPVILFEFGEPEFYEI